MFSYLLMVWIIIVAFFAIRTLLNLFALLIQTIINTNIGLKITFELNETHYSILKNYTFRATQIQTSH